MSRFLLTAEQITSLEEFRAITGEEAIELIDLGPEMPATKPPRQTSAFIFRGDSDPTGWYHLNGIGERTPGEPRG